MFVCYFLSIKTEFYLKGKITMLWVVAIFEESIRKWVYIDNRQEAN
jgi:hypothetical protein